MITSPYLRRPCRTLPQAQLDHLRSESDDLHWALAFYSDERRAECLVVIERNPFLAAELFLAMLEERRRQSAKRLAA